MPWKGNVVAILKLYLAVAYIVPDIDLNSRSYIISMYKTKLLLKNFV